MDDIVVEENNEDARRPTNCVVKEALARFEATTAVHNLHNARRRLADADETAEEHRESIRNLEEELANERLQLAAQEALKFDIESRMDALKDNVENQNRVAAAVVSAIEDSVVDVDSLDILGFYRSRNDDDDDDNSETESQCMGVVQRIRQLMGEGKVEEARKADDELSKLLSSDNELPSSKTLSSPGEYVQKALFVPPYGICSNEELDATIKYAKAHPEKVLPSRMESFMTAIELYFPRMAPQARQKIPKDVNLQVLKDMWSIAKVLENRRDEDDGENLHGNEEGGEAGSDSDDAMWDAIVPVVRSHLERKKELNRLQLTLPSERSAPIARFNIQAHMQFSSPTAVETMEPLTRALVRCELREVPPILSSRERGPRPLVLDPPLSIMGNGLSGCSINVEGDLLAFFCGNELHCRQVPAYTNLDSAVRQDQLVSNGMSSTWMSRLAQGRTVADCVADSTRDLVWASYVSGDVHAYSIAEASADDPETESRDDAYSISEASADDPETESRDDTRYRVAHLSFAEREKQASGKYLGGGSFGIRRMGDYLVGTSWTSRLTIWSIKDALDSYGLRKDSEVDSGLNDNKERAEKVAKLCHNNGGRPRFVEVDDDPEFECDNVEWLGGSQLLICSNSNDVKKNASLRLFDVANEQVVGLYCGLKGSMSMESQLCVDRFNSIFVADDQSSYVFDMRTYKPCMTLATGHSRGQILGVPGEASMTAFAFCKENAEEIQCWDLRMPSSHAYSMWTGNNDITSLFWHEPSASLLASTFSSHGLSWGSCFAYRDGEMVDLDEGEDSDWPKQAVHDPNYFGNENICYHFDRPSVIQYSFASGKPMA